MNAQKLNTWLSLGANIGVVIGLMLLIIEIGQNTEMMRAQINQHRTDTALSAQQAVYTSDHIPAMLARIERGDQLSDEDLIRYERFFELLIEIRTTTFGNITEAIWEKIFLAQSRVPSVM